MYVSLYTYIYIYIYTYICFNYVIITITVIIVYLCYYNKHWNISYRCTKSGAAEPFLLLGCRAGACAQIVLYIDCV